MMIVLSLNFNFFMFARLKIVSLMATKCDEIDGKSSVNCHLRYDEKKKYIDSNETHHERQPVITAETEIVSNKNFSRCGVHDPE